VESRRLTARAIARPVQIMTQANPSIFFWVSEAILPFVFPYRTSVRKIFAWSSTAVQLCSRLLLLPSAACHISRYQGCCLNRAGEGVAYSTSKQCRNSAADILYLTSFPLTLLLRWWDDRRTYLGASCRQLAEATN
jgi:hypothetical protein